MTIKSKLVAVLQPVLYHHHQNVSLPTEKKSRRRFPSTFMAPSLTTRRRKSTPSKDHSNPYAASTATISQDKLPPSPSTSSIMSLPCIEAADASLPPSPSLTPTGLASFRLPKFISLTSNPQNKIFRRTDDEQLALISLWLLLHVGLQLMVGFLHPPAKKVQIRIAQTSVEENTSISSTQCEEKPTSELYRLLKAPCFGTMANASYLRVIEDHDQHMAKYWRSRPTSRRARRHAAAIDDEQDLNDDQENVMHPAVVQLAQGALQYVRNSAVVTDQLQQLLPRMENCVLNAALH